MKKTDGSGHGRSPAGGTAPRKHIMITQPHTASMALYDKNRPPVCVHCGRLLHGVSANEGCLGWKK